jgi:hypothetical protein
MNNTLIASSPEPRVNGAALRSAIVPPAKTLLPVIADEKRHTIE